MGSHGVRRRPQQRTRPCGGALSQPYVLLGTPYKNVLNAIYLCIPQYSSKNILTWGHSMSMGLTTPPQIFFNFIFYGWER